MLLENIVGRQGVIYHRTSQIGLENIKNTGFKVGAGAHYGEGVYFTYDLESQLRENMIRLYGEYIIKSRMFIDKFLIFDKKVSKLVYGKELNIHEQIELHKFDYEKEFGNSGYKDDFEETVWKADEAFDLDDQVSMSAFAKDIYEYSNLFIQKYINGIIYFGGKQDGNAGVIYNERILQPMQYCQYDVYELEDKEKPEWHPYYTKKSDEIYNKELKKIQYDLNKRYHNIAPSDYNGNRIVNIRKMREDGYFVNLFGIINKNGEEIIEPKYKYIEPLYDEYYIIKDSDFYGILNSITKKKLIEPEKHEYTAIKTARRGDEYINIKNYIIIRKDEYEALAKIEDDEVIFLTGFDFQEIYPEGDSESYRTHKAYGFSVKSYNEDGQVEGIIDLDGNYVIPMVWSRIEYIGQERFKARDYKRENLGQKREYLLDNRGKEIELKYKSGKAFDAGEFKRMEIYRFGYDEIAKIDGYKKDIDELVYGAIDLNGVIIIPMEYKSISIERDVKFIIVGKEEKFAVFNFEGKQLTEFIYDSASTVRDGRMIMYRGKGFYFVNADGSEEPIIKKESLIIECAELGMYKEALLLMEDL